MADKNLKQQIFDELGKTPVVQIMCQKLGVGRTSYYRLRKEDPAFAKLADEALDEGRKVINDLGETTVISLMKNQQDIKAARFWLTHNDPRYSNKIELKGNFIHSLETLPPELEELLKKAARMALPQQNYDQPKSEEKTGGEDDSEHTDQ